MSRCSYLVEYCGLSLDSALSEYAFSSPPGVYSQYHLEVSADRACEIDVVIVPNIDILLLLEQQLYRKYFSTLESPSSRLTCPPYPKWDSRGSKKSKSEIGPEILTEKDRANRFVPKQNSVPSRPQATTPVSNGKPTYTPPPPVYKPPLYIPPDRADINSRPAKRRKIRSWMDEVTSLAFGETVDPSSEEHANVTKALESLTGHEGFPGCEVSMNCILQTHL